MALFSPGFRGRRSSSNVPLPPGQYLTKDFPVLSAGPTPRVRTDLWEFVITTEISQEHRWSWTEMLALPSETPTVDVHCVTRWSKLATSWQGVSLDTLFADVDTRSDYAMIHS
jgi:DMSO/TMAO reductase YedYZ molybdopterin-dependent catalytic subunit